MLFPSSRSLYSTKHGNIIKLRCLLPTKSINIFSLQAEFLMVFCLLHDSEPAPDAPFHKADFLHLKASVTPSVYWKIKFTSSVMLAGFIVHIFIHLYGTVILCNGQTNKEFILGKCLNQSQEMQAELLQ